jgi:hypothetical protein
MVYSHVSIKLSSVFFDQQAVYPPNNHKILYLQYQTRPTDYGMIKRFQNY